VIPLVAIATYLVVINLKQIIRGYKAFRQKTSAWGTYLLMLDCLDRLVKTYYLALERVLRRPLAPQENSDPQADSESQEDTDSDSSGSSRLQENSVSQEDPSRQEEPATQEEKPPRRRLGHIIQRTKSWKRASGPEGANQVSRC